MFEQRYTDKVHESSLFIAKHYFKRMIKFGPNNDAILQSKLRRTITCFSGTMMTYLTEQKAYNALRFYFTKNLKMQIKVVKTKNILTFM
jgi:hypothetical protein